MINQESIRVRSSTPWRSAGQRLAEATAAGQNLRPKSGREGGLDRPVIWSTRRWDVAPVFQDILVDDRLVSPPSLAQDAGHPPLEMVSGLNFERTAVDATWSS